MHVDITTFGYRHGEPPLAHLTINLRDHFRDPHIDPAMREMTAEDPQVRGHVMATPGIYQLLAATADVVKAFGFGNQSMKVAVGCAGGRHRAAVFGDMLKDLILSEVTGVSVTHRDLKKPVVER